MDHTIGNMLVSYITKQREKSIHFFDFQGLGLEVLLSLLYSVMMHLCFTFCDFIVSTTTITDGNSNWN